MRLLIGYDGSQCANDALVDLCRAGLPDKLDALVMTVAEIWHIAPPSEFGAIGNAQDSLPQYMDELASSANQQAQQTAEKGAATLRELFPGWSIQIESTTDSPAWGLVHKAEQWKPDLLVVGSHGHSALGRLILGSISQKVVAHAPCPVRIARLRPTHIKSSDKPARIVIAADGSPASRLAAGVAAQRHWPTDSEIRVVTVLHPVLYAALPTLTPLGEIPAGVEPITPANEPAYLTQTAESTVNTLREAGYSASFVLLEGDPKRTLVNYAEEWDADCIFLGAKGHSRIERFLLGSVSSAVATRAHCSVEIIHPVRA